MLPSTLSSSACLPSLVIDRRGCQRLRIILACLILLSLAGVGYAGLPLHWQAAAGLLVVCAGLSELRHASPHSPHFVGRIALAPGGPCLVWLGAAADAPVPVAVTRFWFLPGIAAGLAFEAADRRRFTAILFRDRVPPDSWRRLAVLLRHPSAAVKTARLT